MAIAPLDLPALTPSGVLRRISIARDALVDLAADADAALWGERREQALDVAEAVESVARLLHELQLVAARAVDECAPAPLPALALVDHQGGSATRSEGEAVGSDWFAEPRRGDADACSADADAHCENAQASAGRSRGQGTCDGPTSGSPGARGDTRRSPFRRATDLLAARVRISRYEAARRIRLGRRVLPRRSPVGGPPLSPEREHIGEVLPQIDRAAATHILRACDRVIQVAGRERGEEAEAFLAHQALVFDPDAVGRLADRIIAYVDPDGAAPREDGVLRQELTVGRTRNGLTPVRLVLDTIQLETLLTVVDAGTNPRGQHADTGASGGATPSVDLDASGGSNTAREAVTESEPQSTAVGGLPDMKGNLPDLMKGDLPAVTDGTSSATCRDGRSRGRVMLDTLMAACAAALRLESLPQTGGLPTQVMVTIPLAALTGLSPGGPNEGLGGRGRSAPVSATATDPAATAVPAAAANPAATAAADPAAPAGWETPDDPTARRDTTKRSSPRWETPDVPVMPHVGPVPIGMVRRLACDADLIPVVLGTPSRVLDLGRRHRLYPAWMRRAMVARDGGCTFPACTVPATWCEAHHLIEWWRGGPTTLDTSALLCPAHHHAVHTGEWTCERDPDGHLTFSPPWPTTPRLVRNPHHHGR